MSIEIDFRARALAHAPLVALVGQRVALSAAPQGADLPLVVYGVQHSVERTLDGTIAEELGTIDAECWAETSAAAEAVADALVVATEHSQAASACWLIARAPDLDADTGLHVTTVRLVWSV
jgi:hypothetical protein